MKIYCCFLIMLAGSVVFAQRAEETGLLSRSFEELISLYDNNVKDTLFAREIAQAYIVKARGVSDSTKMARGYQRLAFLSSTSKALKYLDTTIILSKNSAHINFPASGYLFKSYYLYQNEEYEQSLKNAILGYRFAKEKNNLEQQLTALHQINGVNELWGDYERALQTGFLTYELLFEHKEIEGFSEYYLSSLEGIGKCYVRLNKPDSALVYFRKGIDEALKKKDSTTYYAFVSQSGTALYVKGDYKAAMDSLQKADVIRDQFNNSYLPNFYYYVGSILYGQGEKEKGISYFKKIDSIYEKRHVLYPELPRVYDKLISYYGEQEDTELQLKYLYKLVLALRLIDDKKIFIKEKTARDYEIPKLVEEKELLIADLEEKNKASKIFMWGAFAFLALSIAILIYYIHRQRVYKKRFENLMNDKENDNIETAEVLDLKDSGISPLIVEDILGHLKTFEEQNHFLSQEISLNELAKSFGTNSTYLSKVINIKMGKNFSHYLNELRINFATEGLKNNPIFRKYTIKAIANESGFKSAESFSKTFYKQHGIYPSYYLKQLRSKEENKKSG